jgi:hypothetical protein
MTSMQKSRRTVNTPTTPPKTSGPLMCGSMSERTRTNTDDMVLNPRKAVDAKHFQHNSTLGAAPSQATGHPGNLAA